MMIVDLLELIQPLISRICLRVFLTEYWGDSDPTFIHLCCLENVLATFIGSSWTNVY